MDNTDDDDVPAQRTKPKRTTKKKRVEIKNENGVVETKLERRRRLGRERRARFWAKKSEQELINARRHDLERRKIRMALLKQAVIDGSACLHCNDTESVNTDVSDIKFSANGQIYTLGECYTLITGIKIESGKSAKTKICQMCQNQLIATYNFKRQYLQQEPNIKKEFAATPVAEDGSLNFATVLVAEFGQETKPVIRSLPELGPPIMPIRKDVEHECTTCRMKFKNARGYQHHQKLVHSDRYVCEYCGFQTIYKPQIRDHLMSHLMGYVCGVCDQKFPNRILRKQHQQLKHIVSNGGATELEAADLGIKIQCNYCGLFVNKISLRSHLQSHANKIKCDQCNKVFKNRKTLASHVWMAHTETPPEDSVKCQFCSQVYFKQIYLDRHLEKVHGSSVQGSSSSQYRVEERPRTEETAHEYTIKCGVCPKIFTRQPYLDRHMAKVHMHKLPHICHTCGNSYEKEQLLINHQVTHTGKHECQICHARFAFATGLVHHTKKIHIETCFTCTVPKCGEVLASEVMLDHHSNIHSTAMPVECSVCDEAFDHFFALYDHYEVKHRLAKCIYQRSRQDNCKCLHCDKKFPILNYLKFHIVSKTLGEKHSTECKYCHQWVHTKKRR